MIDLEPRTSIFEMGCGAAVLSVVKKKKVYQIS
jgi:hypothetical protein